MGNVIQTESFKIIGISVRTTNKNGQSMTDIGKLWNKFYSDNIMALIPDRVSDDVFAVYTDYQSDYTEDYTTIIGCQVKSFDQLPGGLVGSEIPGGKYLKYNCKGKMPDAIMNKWKEIWENDKELRRKYTTDYEVYGKSFQNPENPEMDIYIAIE